MNGEKEERKADEIRPDSYRGIERRRKRSAPHALAILQHTHEHSTNHIKQSRPPNHSNPLVGVSKPINRLYPRSSMSFARLIVSGLTPVCVCSASETETELDEVSL